MNVTMLRPRPSGPRTAFVLGGGGNLGAIQIGMLQALSARGIQPDVLVGASVGAVNAVGMALDPSPEGIEHLRRTWLDPATGQVFSSGRLGGPWQLFRRGRSMVGNERLRSLLDGSVGTRRFEDLEVPLHVVATSLRTGRERWFSSGPVTEAVLASAALPAVLPPVEIDGEAYIDGGVIDNVPISRAVDLEVERVVVLHVGNFDRPRPDPQRPLDVLLQAFSIARSYRFEAERAKDHGVELLVLPGIDPGSLRRNDFSRTSNLIDRARRTAGAWLDEHPVAVGH
jgi:NTE family protein